MQPLTTNSKWILQMATAQKVFLTCVKPMSDSRKELRFEMRFLYNFTKRIILFFLRQLRPQEIQQNVNQSALDKFTSGKTRIKFMQEKTL